MEKLRKKENVRADVITRTEKGTGEEKQDEKWGKRN
jgi:hypothetical protein